MWRTAALASPVRQAEEGLECGQRAVARWPRPLGYPTEWKVDGSGPHLTKAEAGSRAKGERIGKGADEVANAGQR